MRAVWVTRHGGPEVLEVAERPDPVPGPGELLVQVAACGVNFLDTYVRTGTGAYAGELPYIPGAEGAGSVIAVGPDVDGVAPGDRVAWATGRAGYAERVVVAARSAVPVPAVLGLPDAAAALLQGMTAQYLCHSCYPVQPGDTVLVHAGAGGVGALLIQLVVRRGGSVIATASDPRKAAIAREAGAAHVLAYAEVPGRVRELTGGAGVAAVYDGVGRDTFEASLAALRPRGVLALFGAASGPVPPFDVQRLNGAGSLFLTRPTLGHYVATREELLERAGDVFGAVADASLRLRIGGRYELGQAAEAHRDLEGRRTTGKLLLVPAGAPG